MRLTGLRPESEAVPIEDSLLLAAAPQLQIFPWGEKQFPVGISMNRPYLLTGLTVESPVTELDLRPSFRFGLGTEMNLFGLYPSDISSGSKWIGCHRHLEVRHQGNQVLGSL